MNEYRIPASLIWRMRLTTGAFALFWFALFSIVLGVPALLLLRLSSGLDGLLAFLVGAAGVAVSLLYAVALFWWASTWGRMALGPWGGAGAFLGAFVSVVVVPGLIWFVSDVAYAIGLWPVGAVLRIAAWLWFGAALIGVWRWIAKGSPES